MALRRVLVRYKSCARTRARDKHTPFYTIKQEITRQKIAFLSK